MRRLNRKTRRIGRKLGSIKNLLPQIKWKVLTYVAIVALVTSQVFLASAFEAHIINVTAKIVNALPNVEPCGGTYCNTEAVLVEITTEFSEASIIYTIDDSDPICNVYGLEYSGAFMITESLMIKARSCWEGKQSPIVAQYFELAPEYCNCGDGRLDAGEECDDGNNIDNDGCSADCRLEECEEDIYCTQTQGGWGQKCKGNNVGCLRDNYWEAVVNGSLNFGKGYSIGLSNAEAAKSFFPQGGTPDFLAQNHLDPISTEAGILGGQVGALKLNVLFSEAGIGLVGESSTGLGDLVIAIGKLAGMSVYQLLSLAEDVLGGDISRLETYSASISDVNDAVTYVNENFVDCEEDNGFLLVEKCDEEIAPAIQTQSFNLLGESFEPQIEPKKETGDEEARDEGGIEENGDEEGSTKEEDGGTGEETGNKETGGEIGTEEEGTREKAGDEGSGEGSGDEGTGDEEIGDKESNPSTDSVDSQQASSEQEGVEQENTGEESGGETGSESAE